MNTRLLLLGLMIAALSGCSHKTLIAPCDGNVGQIGGTLTPLGDGLNVSPTAAPPTTQAPHDCGPLKPVNLQPLTE